MVRGLGDKSARTETRSKGVCGWTDLARARGDERRLARRVEERQRERDLQGARARARVRVEESTRDTHKTRVLTTPNTRFETFEEGKIHRSATDTVAPPWHPGWAARVRHALRGGLRRVLDVRDPAARLTPARVQLLSLGRVRELVAGEQRRGVACKGARARASAAVIARRQSGGQAAVMRRACQTSRPGPRRGTRGRACMRTAASGRCLRTPGEALSRQRDKAQPHASLASVRAAREAAVDAENGTNIERQGDLTRETAPGVEGEGGA